MRYLNLIQVISKDMGRVLCRDFKELKELEEKEFSSNDSHLALEERKALIEKRIDKLNKLEANILADIDQSDLTDKEKEADRSRLKHHITHYVRGLKSMLNATKWRNKPVVDEADWKIDPAGQGLKLKESKKGGIASFSLPAGLTCPKAGSCKNHCFALSGHNHFSTTARDSHSKALGLAERDEFVQKMDEHIQKLKKFKYSDTPNPEEPFRIHAWGDFYSNKYAEKWIQIIKDNPNVWFYAYTKSFRMPAIQKLMADIDHGAVKNAKIIQSVNGKDDSKIDSRRPIAVVFKTKEDMDAWNAGQTYIAGNNGFNKVSKKLTKLGVFQKDGTFEECSDSDLVASRPQNPRVGIVEHGTLIRPQSYDIEDVDKEIRAAVIPKEIGCEHLAGFGLETPSEKITEHYFNV